VCVVPPNKSSVDAKAGFRSWRIAPGSLKAYAFAIVLVTISTVLNYAFGLITSYLQAFTTFYPAVLLATLVGGSGPGIFATLLSGVICWLFFLPPFTHLLPLSMGDKINLLTFLVASLFIVWATDHYRKLTKRLRDEESLRKLAVDELAHRLKNKIATIQSIVALRLRDQPQLRDAISRALGSLMATDDLIIAAQGKGAQIRSILAAELAPYGLSRFSMTGRDFLFPSKLALTFALLMHELATNAAKYGALSIPTGKLNIEWTLMERRLNLVWREKDGPPVMPPRHRGFGTKLFQRGLEQFDGSVDVDFAPAGLVCKLSLAIPENEAGELPETPETPAPLQPIESE
jgi:two-component sensor histidine kinase